MEQRTCNIIMACKGHCQLPGGKDAGPLDAVAAYMSHECAYPMENYKGKLMETVMREALFDYFSTADKPASALRTLLAPSYLREPTLSERIVSVFSLADIRSNGQPVNGFTEKLLSQSEIDLGERPGLATGLPDSRPVGPDACGGCVGFIGNTDERCGACSRNPDASGGTIADRYAMAPGILCQGCASNAAEGGDGACQGCGRSPAAKPGRESRDKYRKRADGPSPEEGNDP